MKEMKRTIISTTDGSHTVEIPELHVTYHSRHGAVQESMHVFIDAGLRYVLQGETAPRPLRIFEMGLGTGLNALLTVMEAEKEKVPILYTAVEAFPLKEEEWRGLNYGDDETEKEWLRKIHKAPWREEVAISDYFTLKKKLKKLADFSTTERFHLVYYDAFAPGAQPKLWTREVFAQLHTIMEPGGVLVTYCSKGDVRRAMLAAGFSVEKIPGPPGKREMLRATAHPTHTPAAPPAPKGEHPRT
jgi:tRNA U34 5-methylaminomethyl-2-thiouridine-forming methyltransferase MnmC